MFKTRKIIAMILALVFALSICAAPVFAEEPALGLKDIYKDYFLMGNLQSREAEVITNFNVATLENNMKPDACAGTSITAAYRFRGDTELTNMIADGRKVWGHVLVWHSQTPNWMFTGATGGTRELAKRNMENHIKTVVEHYDDPQWDGNVIGWDVLNEFFTDGVPDNPFADGSTWRDYARGGPNGGNSNWYTAYKNGMDEEAGEHPTDFVYDAFVFARRYTDLPLLYNDFNLYFPGKADCVAAMVAEFNAKYQEEYPDDPRLLIEAVGLQSHNYMWDTEVDMVEESIKKFVGLGLKVHFTELDLHMFAPWNGMPSTTYQQLSTLTADQLVGVQGSDEQKYYWANLGVANGAEAEVHQAIRFAEYFSLFKKYSDYIERVTFWGHRDNATWRAGHYPLIFNGDHSPKEAYYGIADPEGYLARVHQAPAYDFFVESDKETVGKGGAFNADIRFAYALPTNKMSLVLSYDGSVLVFDGFTAAGGLGVVDLVETEGRVVVTLVNPDGYSAREIGTAAFTALEGAAIDDGEWISVTAGLDYDYRDAAGETRPLYVSDTLSLLMSNLSEQNAVSLSVAPNTVLLAGEKTIDVKMSVQDLTGGANVVSGNIRVADPRFTVSVTASDPGAGTVYNPATGEFTLFRLGGFADADSADLLNIALTLNEGAALKSGDTVDTILNSIAFTLAPNEIPSGIKNKTAATKVWITSGVVGDVEGDGKVDAKDLSYALTLFGKRITDADWYSSMAYAADYNGDGLIDMEDITAIAYLSIGLPIS